MPIRILDPGVIAQIAAGEVVERPASVIKELVENSLDAGATQISVDTAGGGIELMRVTDNGSGIPSTEVELAFERHATSKISTMEDLASITSLGFRGEALASIAAAGDVELLTRTAGESMGSHLNRKDDITIRRNNQARTQGTTITVTHLFRKIPARLKFLKSIPTENSHIADVISQYALAYPEVRFNLIIEGRKTLQTPGNGRLIDSIIEVYGIDVAHDMLELNSTDIRWQDGIRYDVNIQGMVGKPSISRTGRGYQSFFINRRWISSRLLTSATEEAYHGMLMQGRHPLVIINLEVHPSEIDVNIHPSKTEVKFSNEKAVFGAIQKAIRRTLVQQGPVPKIEDNSTIYTSLPPLTQQPNQQQAIISSYPENKPNTGIQTEIKSLPIMRVLGQFAKNYIITEGNDGIYIIDQHAAHERVRFEQILEQRSSNAIEIQGLLEPVTLDVSPTQSAVSQVHYMDLVKFGFSLEPFGERAIIIRTVPAILYNKDWKAVLHELLDSLTSGENNTNWTERVTASMACHSAIRAGQILTENEMRELIKQLENPAMPRTCPHGRPIILHLSLNQLEKEFGRTVTVKHPSPVIPDLPK
jgi:DNA mismatch repair protein MutL